MFKPLRTLFLVLTIAALAQFSLSQARVAKSRWQKGRLISANISGQGSNSKGRNASGRPDIWWEYCIGSDGQVYSAVSRVNPAKAKLSVGDSITFEASRDRVQILTPKGTRLSMRILRNEPGKQCR